MAGYKVQNLGIDSPAFFLMFLINPQLENDHWQKKNMPRASALAPQAVSRMRSLSSKEFH
jgi:hypothetical protein